MTQKGEVCINYKEHVPLIKRDDICTLDNCLVFEICSQGEKCFFDLYILFPKSEPWWVWWFMYKIWFTSEQYKSNDWI